jgi:hypothetical protein
MPKHKKTREQKIATSQKHHQQNQPTQFHYSLTGLQQHMPDIAKAVTVSVAVADNSIAKDLKKTLFISLFLVAGEVLLYMLLHQHILKLPWTFY